MPLRLPSIIGVIVLSIILGLPLYGAPENAEPRYGGTLVLANRGDPPAGFDSMRTSSIALHHVAGALFGPGNLVMRCRENMYFVCPYLARSWTANQDFTEWTFVIRQDVVWHDGERFTAEDVEFWLNLVFSAPNRTDGYGRPPIFRTSSAMPKASSFSSTIAFV